MRQGFGKAYFMTIRVSDVKVTFTPLRISRFVFGIEICRDSPRIDSIYVGHVKYYAAPPGPAGPGRLKRQIEPMAGAHGKSREACVRSAIAYVETERAVERHRCLHIVCRQSYSAETGQPRCAAFTFMYRNYGHDLIFSPPPFWYVTTRFYTPTRLLKQYRLQDSIQTEQRGRNSDRILLREAAAVVSSRGRNRICKPYFVGRRRTIKSSYDYKPQTMEEQT